MLLPVAAILPDFLLTVCCVFSVCLLLAVSFCLLTVPSLPVAGAQRPPACCNCLCACLYVSFPCGRLLKGPVAASAAHGPCRGPLVASPFVSLPSHNLRGMLLPMPPKPALCSYFPLLAPPMCIRIGYLSCRIWCSIERIVLVTVSPTNGCLCVWLVKVLLASSEQ